MLADDRPGSNHQIVIYRLTNLKVLQISLICDNNYSSIVDAQSKLYGTLTQVLNRVLIGHELIEQYILIISM